MKKITRIGAASGGSVNLASPGPIGGTTPGSGAFTTLSASGAALFADGTAAAPSIGWTSDADGSGTGFFRSGASAIAATLNGTEALRLNSGGLQVFSAGGSINMNSATGTFQIASDAKISRVSSQNLRIGGTSSATPLANTLSIGESSRSGTDANVAGASGTIASGTGTGTGTVSSLIFQTPTVAGAGTGAQALATRLAIDSAGATFASAVSLTAGSVTISSGAEYRFSGASRIASAGNGKIKITNAAGTAGITLDATTADTLKVSNFADSADGTLTAGAGTFSGPVTLKGYTVATLPAGTVGMTAYVTDATAPTYLGALTGGGAVTCPVFYNGAAWVSH